MEDTDLDTSYKAYCSMLINTAKQSVPCGYQNYIPCWDEECQELYEQHTASMLASSEGSEARANILIKRLDEKRSELWIETVESIDFTLSSQKAWHTINRLTGRTASKPDKCLMSANAVASQLLQNDQPRLRPLKASRKASRRAMEG